MNKIFQLNSVFILILFILCGCNSKQNTNVSDPDILHNNQDQLTQVIIYDVFTPPVASRIYAYSSLASYEAMRFAKPGSPSLITQLNGFKILPEPEKGKDYNYTLAATRAFFTVVHKVVFSLDSLKDYEERTYAQFKNSLDQSVYERSVQFGDSIGKVILARAAQDNYKQTRAMPKHLGNDAPGKWRPTSPDYFDGVEAYWGRIRPFVLDSAELANAEIQALPEYSLEPKSKYHQEVMGLYNVTNKLTKEQKEIARYWDDNPFVVEHSGHMMFANKKITPGGHWMGITAIASKQTKADAVKTAKAYAATAIAMYDGFICCWNLKYKYNTVRPITVINEKIDGQWQPMLQTPPFPEFPSGHSTITSAAATVLTKIFGDNFAFEDTSDLKYIGMKRNFKSFLQAANEASISRVYGGIHYRYSVDHGFNEGKKVGDRVIEKLRL
ncbi:vanadium-dependent haloperoxidase [Flavihumibacter sp. R14]|nr:vanadium-dependent haloperoxidase [Flavihumibacter soli]